MSILSISVETLENLKSYWMSLLSLEDQLSGDRISDDMSSILAKNGLDWEVFQEYLDRD